MKTRLTAPHPIRIAIIEDESLLLDAVKLALGRTRGLSIVGDARSRTDGLAMVTRTQPHVLLLDVGLTDGSGLDLLHELKRAAPQTRCLILTGMHDNRLILQAIRRAADGFLFKNCGIPRLVKAIRRLACGQTAWEPELLMRVAGSDGAGREDAQETGIGSLNPVETRIAGFIAEGMTNREIGTQMHLAEKTIRNRISLIMDKLQVSRRSRIASLFIQGGGPGERARPGR